MWSASGFPEWLGGSQGPESAVSDVISKPQRIYPTIVKRASH